MNRGPVIVGSVWLDYAENGTGPVHTFLARDPESDTVTWSLAGDDSGAFSITGGVLRFARSPDYEDPNHSSAFRVTVQAADATNRTAHPVAIVVTDVDEPPEISGVTTISGYDENGPATWPPTPPLTPRATATSPGAWAARTRAISPSPTASSNSPAPPTTSARRTPAATTNTRSPSRPPTPTTSVESYTSTSSSRTWTNRP